LSEGRGGGSHWVYVTTTNCQQLLHNYYTITHGSHLNVGSSVVGRSRRWQPVLGRFTEMFCDEPVQLRPTYTTTPSNVDHMIHAVLCKELDSVDHMIYVVVQRTLCKLDISEIIGLSNLWRWWLLRMQFLVNLWSKHQKSMQLRHRDCLEETQLLVHWRPTQRNTDSITVVGSQHA